MAKLSKIEKSKKIIFLCMRYKIQRTECRLIINNRNLNIKEKMIAQEKLQNFPRNSNACRLRSRCILTGRPRGVYRRFGLSRHKIRELGMMGYIPGLRKSSW